MDGSTFQTDLIHAQVSVSPLENSDRADWDAFVMAHPDSQPFHRLAWCDAVREALRYKTPGLIARAAGAVVGVLPLVHLKTPLFGNTLVSTGFSVGGGVLADDDLVAQMLAETAVTLARKLGVDCLELRSETARFEGWPTKSDVYAGFIQPIAEAEEDRLKAIPRKKRADVRKGIKAGFAIDTDAPLDVFHELYARNLHALGTPILPKRWYGALAKHFGGDCEIATVNADGKAVVALLSLYHRETVYPYYVGSLTEARRLHAYDHVYWDLMGRALERGAIRFDFGRSKFGTGAADYKKHWGFEARPLAYQYHLVGADAVPDVNPNNPKYAAFVKMWKKLPFAATTRLGPLLARQLG